jgi:hypothetical protein
MDIRYGDCKSGLEWTLLENKQKVSVMDQKWSSVDFSGLLNLTRGKWQRE